MLSSGLKMNSHNVTTTKTTMRTNTQVCLSFGQDEVELLKLLDEGRKRDYLSRSAWFKNQIRKVYGKKRKLTGSLVMTYVGVKLAKEDVEMMNTILRKLPKFRMKKMPCWWKHYTRITRTKSRQGGE